MWNMKKFYDASREINDIPATSDVTMRIPTGNKPGALISISKSRRPQTPPALDDRQCQNRMIWSHGEPSLKRPAVGAPSKNPSSGLKNQSGPSSCRVPPPSRGTSHVKFITWSHFLSCHLMLWPDSVLQLSLSTLSSNLLERIHARLLARDWWL